MYSLQLGQRKPLSREALSDSCHMEAAAAHPGPERPGATRSSESGRQQTSTAAYNTVVFLLYLADIIPACAASPVCPARRFDPAASLRLPEVKTPHMDL